MWLHRRAGKLETCDSLVKQFPLHKNVKKPKHGSSSCACGKSKTFGSFLRCFQNVGNFWIFGVDHGCLVRVLVKMRGDFVWGTILLRWSDHSSMPGCLVDGKLSRRRPSAKRLSRGRSHNNVARKTDRFGKSDVRKSRKWNKAFQKRAEHSHASETLDGHRTIVRGTSREGPLSTGPIKLSGGA